MKTLTAFLVLMVAAPVAMATTWHVAKDGSGDFSVIQDAVDAAEDGDVIWIHAGRYDEMTHDAPLFTEANTHRADVHVAIWKDDLTLRGDGPDVTIIGSEELPPPPPHFRQYGIGVTHYYASRLTIENLRIENVRTGVYAVNPEISIDDCCIQDLGKGLFLNLQDSAQVINTRFNNCWDLGVVTFDCSNVFVSNCLVEDTLTALGFSGTSHVNVESCRIVGGGRVYSSSKALVLSKDVVYLDSIPTA